MEVLDLFCGAGGAAMGYNLAWPSASITGVDINPQPNYPFNFVRADAIEYLIQFGHEFDLIHASPPCQGYTALRVVHKNEHPLLIDATRQALALTGKLTVLENVKGAKLNYNLMLCGEMFGLAVLRHRYFELSWNIQQPPHIKHRGKTRGFNHGIYHDGPYLQIYGTGGVKGSLQEWRDAMEMQWCLTKAEIAEAIPPAYTRFIASTTVGFLCLPPSPPC